MEKWVKSNGVLTIALYPLGRDWVMAETRTRFGTEGLSLHGQGRCADFSPLVLALYSR